MIGIVQVFSSVQAVKQTTRCQGFRRDIVQLQVQLYFSTLLEIVIGMKKVTLPSGIKQI
jgi:hypothetical protein